MKINYKYTTIILSVLVITLTSVVAVLAGNTDPPSGPTDAGSQMYTLEQIYNRLTTGAWQTKMTAFTEPISGPGATGRTLDEVMAVARPGALAPRVNKTGQTGCWDSAGNSITCTGTGQDGEYQMGIAPAIAPTCCGTTHAYNTPVWTGVRFTDNGDGTVTDNLTALVWLKNANCFGIRNWSNALGDANTLASGSCGLTDGSSVGDWRLPNINELHSLIDLTQSNPALPSGHPFTGVRSSGYWSSTAYAPDPYYAWYVHLYNGYVNGDNKPGALYVWPVRGGQ